MELLLCIAKYTYLAKCNVLAALVKIGSETSDDPAGATAGERWGVIGHRGISQAGTNASTRNGLPEPPLIFNGAENSKAPVGGNWSRFFRHCRP